jgi:hypothetical protein
MVPIDPNLFCPKPKSLWRSLNLNLRVGFLKVCYEIRIWFFKLILEMGCRLNHDYKKLIIGEL